MTVERRRHLSEIRTVRCLGLLLAGAACVNLCIGTVLALRDPARASDLWTMYEWCRGWVFGGQPLYTVDAATDYPPNAIVQLSPIALLPTAWVVPVWTAFSLALSPLLPYIVLRCAAPGNRRAIVTPILLFLCWTSARTLLQFSVLSMTLAALSLFLADSHPLGSGVSLGLALAKPHIAGPIALWMLATRRFRALLIAIAVVAAGWGVYDARIGESPLTTLIGYGRILRAIYSGPDGLAGRTSIRSWTMTLLPDARAADAVWLSVSILFVLGAWVLARRSPRQSLHAGGMAVPGLFCLCSLLAIYHNINNLLLMLPAFAFLWCRAAAARRSAAAWWPVAAIQAALTVDVPTRIGPLMANRGWLAAVVDSADRVLVLATFVYVAAVWVQMTPAPQHARLKRL